MTSSKKRDLLLLQVEYTAKEPYLQKDKRGEISVTVDYSVWNSMESLSKAASKIHLDFPKYWKQLKENHPRKEFLKLDLVNCLFLLMEKRLTELENWIEETKKNKSYLFNLPFESSNWA